MKAFTNNHKRNHRPHGRLTPAGTQVTRSTLRRAFTLVELMVVIVIISILMALIIPATMKVRERVIEGRVATEIKQLESGVSAFKAKYGVEPPSQFRLYLTQAGWNSDPASMALVRRIWPNFDYTMGDAQSNGAAAGVNYPSFWWGMSANGTKPIAFNSGECLLFFLGGVIPVQGPNQIPVGFAKNPSYPFAPPATSSNREGPFFELTDVSRIKDFDGNGLNEWYDSIPNQTAPYLYFSSYEGSGYRVAGTGSELPTGSTLVDVYRIFSPSGTNTTIPQAGPSNGTIVGSQTLPAQKPQSFQIISPGYDGKYGTGGVYNPQLNNSGLVSSYNGSNPVYDTDAFDNITNFSGGRLK
ncbi:MAG: prepilin-type N-terminal cleavage/methylation domain-containing protein [Planctomycetes bacterium]|nr:prepilin-type N-terminal cleavage/methylation domain-containing protein [Planctomycetota bacterium]